MHQYTKEEQMNIYNQIRRFLLRVKLNHAIQRRAQLLEDRRMAADELKNIEGKLRHFTKLLTELQQGARQ
jgi:hypothetical protein